MYSFNDAICSFILNWKNTKRTNERT